MSDEQLILLQRRLDKHIFESDMHREQNQKMFSQLLEFTKANTKSIGELTAAVDATAKSTAGIVEVYIASQGAIKVGTVIGRFAKWITGIAILGVGFKWVIDHLNGPPLN